MPRYVAIVLVRKHIPTGETIGYRAKLLDAASPDDATGAFVRSISDTEPDASVSGPSVIEIPATPKEPTDD